MKNSISRLDNPAVFRLAVYIVSGIAGLVMVATGALDADNLADWVTSASTQAGGILALVAGLAGRNIGNTTDGQVIGTIEVVTTPDAPGRDSTGTSSGGTPIDELRRRIHEER